MGVGKAPGKSRLFTERRRRIKVVEEEIRVGDWISWPGVLGRDQGKVISENGESYNVQTRKGDNPVYTKVSKRKGVKKIEPPQEW